MRLKTVMIGAAGLAMAAPLAWTATAQTAGAQTAMGASAGIYSAAQAERGASLYSDRCVACHGASLEGADVAPPLAGARFMANWTSQPVAALTTRIRTTMPLDAPGALGLGETADVTAYLLSQNGYPAGATDMPTGSQPLQAITIDAPPAAK